MDLFCKIQIQQLSLIIEKANPYDQVKTET